MLNYVHQWITNSRYCSGTSFPFPFAVERTVTVPDLRIWKTPEIEHLLHPVTLIKTHSKLLYSDPAKLSKGRVTTNLLMHEKDTAPQKSVVVCGFWFHWRCQQCTIQWQKSFTVGNNGVVYITGGVSLLRESSTKFSCIKSISKVRTGQIFTRLNVEGNSLTISLIFTLNRYPFLLVPYI